MAHPPGNYRCPLGRLQPQVTDLEELRGHVVVAAHARPDAGHQLLGFERFDHVVVRTGLQPQHDVDGVGLGGKHDDRHAGLGTDLSADFDAVLPGQHEVQQDEVGSRLAKQ